MLKTLEVNGFKSILDTKLEFGKVNLFIGANGAGKSNILEAIGVLSAALERGISDIELLRKGVRLSSPILFKSSFKNKKFRKAFCLKAQLEHDIHYDLNITANETQNVLNFLSEYIYSKDNEKYLSRGLEKITLKDIKLKSNPDLDETRGVWDQFKTIVDIPTAMQLELEKQAKFCIYAPQTTFLRGIDVEAIPTKPLGLQGGNVAQAMQTILTFYKKNRDSKITHLVEQILSLAWFSDGIIGIELMGQADAKIFSTQVKKAELMLSFRDKFMHEKRNLLSAYDSSEGSLYLLFLATLLLHPEAPKVFALDNMDNSLNPAITRKVLELLINVTSNERFRKHNIGPEQIFLTSHNPTALDAFDLFNKEQRIFVVSRDNITGATQIEPLEPAPNMTPADWIKIQNGKNLSEMWISGLIPNALGNL